MVISSLSTQLKSKGTLVEEKREGGGGKEAVHMVGGGESHKGLFPAACKPYAGAIPNPHPC